MLLFWLGCLSKAELSKVEDHILCPAIWCKKEVGCFSGQDTASHNLKLRPVLQKSPLAFPLHKFHQSDQSERIAFRASFFHSHSGVWTHTHTHRCTDTDTQQYTTQKRFYMVFDCTSHMSKCSTNLLEIIDFYRFDCSSILHEQTEIEQAGVVRKGKARVFLLWPNKLCMWDVCHIVFLYLSILVIWSVLNTNSGS